MQDFLTPDPMVLAVFTLRKFGYLAFVALLALIRVGVGRGWARLPAVLALMLALAGLAAVLVLPALNVFSGPLYRAGALLQHGAGGFATPLAASALLALSGLVPGRRWPWIDLTHAAGFAGFAVMWSLYG